MDEGQFVSAIDMIAEKLGIAVTEVFNIFVQAQMTIGTLMILKCVILILIGITTYFITMKIISGSYTYSSAIRALDEANKYCDEDMKAFFIYGPMFSSFGMLIVSSFILETIETGLLKILCPEYSTITEIIRLVI